MPVEWQCQWQCQCQLNLGPRLAAAGSPRLFGSRIPWSPPHTTSSYSTNSTNPPTSPPPASSSRGAPASPAQPSPATTAPSVIALFSSTTRLLTYLLQASTGLLLPALVVWQGCQPGSKSFVRSPSKLSNMPAPQSTWRHASNPRPVGRCLGYLGTCSPMARGPAGKRWYRQMPMCHVCRLRSCKEALAPAAS